MSERLSFEALEDGGRYLAYDEGCYECGEPSGVLGFYDTEAEANGAVDAAVTLQNQPGNWGGQHSMHVIDLADPKLSDWSPLRVSQPQEPPQEGE